MPCNETLSSVAFAEALIMLRHDFEAAKIYYLIEEFVLLLKKIRLLEHIMSTLVTCLKMRCRGYCYAIAKYKSGVYGIKQGI